MKTKYVAIVEIEVEHPKGSFVDQNSVKNTVGSMLSWGRTVSNRPWVYDGKHEGPKNHTVTLRSLSEYIGVTSFGSKVEIKDIAEFS